jgi:c-di-GMP-binding flagellar brake protein YcgR
MSVERREFERKFLRGPARITPIGMQPLMVRTLDISAGGACIVSSINLQSKQLLKMEFNLLVRKTGAYTGLVLQAVVAYSAFSQSEDGFKVGLQFALLSDTHKSLILQYLMEPKPPTKTAAPVSVENPLF